MTQRCKNNYSVKLTLAILEIVTKYDASSDPDERQQLGQKRQGLIEQRELERQRFLSAFQAGT